MMSSSSQESNSTTLDPSQLDDVEFVNMLESAAKPRYLLKKSDQNGNNEGQIGINCLSDSGVILKPQTDQFLKNVFAETESKQSAADNDPSRFSDGALHSPGTHFDSSWFSSATRRSHMAKCASHEDNGDVGIEKENLRSFSSFNKFGYSSAPQSVSYGSDESRPSGHYRMHSTDVESTVQYKLNQPVHLSWSTTSDKGTDTFPTNTNVNKSDSEPKEIRIDMGNTGSDSDFPYIDESGSHVVCPDEEPINDSIISDSTQKLRMLNLNPANQSYEMKPLMMSTDDDESMASASYGTMESGDRIGADSKKKKVKNRPRQTGSYNLQDGDRSHNEIPSQQQQDIASQITSFGLAPIGFNREGGRHSPPTEALRTPHTHYGTNNSLTYRNTTSRPGTFPNAERSKRKREEKNVKSKMKAEELEGHQGHRSIESLLEFVEGAVRQEKKSPNNMTVSGNKKKVSPNKSKIGHSGSSSRSLDESALDGYEEDINDDIESPPTNMRSTDDDAETRSTPPSSVTSTDAADLPPNDSNKEPSVSQPKDQTIDLSDPGLYVDDAIVLPIPPVVDEEFIPVQHGKKRKQQKITGRRSYDPVVVHEGNWENSYGNRSNQQRRYRQRRRRNSADETFADASERRNTDKEEDEDEDCVGDELKLTVNDQQNIQQISPKAPSEPGDSTSCWSRRRSSGNFAVNTKPLYSSVASKRPPSPSLGDFIDKSVFSNPGPASISTTSPAGRTITRPSSSLDASRATSPKRQPVGSAVTSNQANASSPELSVDNSIQSSYSTVTAALLSPQLPPAIQTVEQSGGSAAAVEVTVVEAPKVAVKTWASVAAASKTSTQPSQSVPGEAVCEELQQVNDTGHSSFAQSDSVLPGESSEPNLDDTEQGLINDNIDNDDNDDIVLNTAEPDDNDDGTVNNDQVEDAVTFTYSDTSSPGNKSLDITFGWEPNLESAAPSEEAILQHLVIDGGKTITFQVPKMTEANADTQNSLDLRKLNREHAKWIRNIWEEWNRFNAEGPSPVWYRDVMANREGSCGNSNTGTSDCGNKE